MGDALVELRRFHEAVEQFETALRIHPEDPHALRGLATCYLEQNRLEEARPLFVSLLGLAPRDAEAHNNYGVLLANLGDRSNALVHFREALRLRPGYLDALRNVERAEAAGHVPPPGQRP
jgi:Flp pilus assembly protein TadD